MRWIGTGRLSLPRTADGLSDVIAIRKDNGQLLHYPHSGAFGTPGELLPPTVIGDNWHLNDVIFVSDVDEDGADDLVFDPPRLLASGYARAVWLGMARRGGLPHSRPGVHPRRRSAGHVLLPGQQNLLAGHRLADHRRWQRNDIIT